MTHNFDAATSVNRIDGVERYSVRAITHPAYGNMIGPYGGITAATVVRALQEHPDVLGQPLALTINYAAPIADGTWDLELTLVRTNRTNQHWTFTIGQGGAAVATGTAVFGIRRDTWQGTESTPPPAPSVADVASTEFPDFIAWGRSYDKRFVTGTIDDAANDDSTTTFWLCDEPPRPLDYPALMSMTDAFFPRVFLRLGSFMPAGTITLTTYFHATNEELAAHGDQHVLATARGARFGHGHFDQYGQIWGGDVLMATTHQLVYFKDPRSIAV